jgi:dsRNA-specific ribonuclease
MLIAQSYGIAIKLLSNNTLSYLSYSYQLHHELRHINPEMRQPPQKIFADIFEAYSEAFTVPRSG